MPPKTSPAKSSKAAPLHYTKEKGWHHTDPRGDPSPRPCCGEHGTFQEGSNAYAKWADCKACGLRLSYVPREGYSGSTSKVEDPKVITMALNLLEQDVKAQHCTAPMVKLAMEIYKDQSKLEALEKQAYMLQQQVTQNMAKYKIMTKQAWESPATSSTTSLNAEEILKHMSSEEIQRLQELAAQRKRRRRRKIQMWSWFNHRANPRQVRSCHSPDRGQYEDG
jgi:hypothetical protein